MERVVLQTVIHAPPSAIYPVLANFERYPRYATHLEWVEPRGEGPAGPQYDLHLSWWRISHTTRSEIVERDPPHRLGWRLTRDVEARGAWELEERPELAPADAETATRVTFEGRADPTTAETGNLSLPGLLPMDVVIAKARPIVKREVRETVRRLVADVEGHPREVELSLEHESVAPSDN